MKRVLIAAAIITVAGAGTAFAVAPEATTEWLRGCCEMVVGCWSSMVG